MSVGLRHKFRTLAVSLLLAITTTLALSAAAVPAALVDQPYVSEASQQEGGPPPACFEHHSPFERDAVATAPVGPIFLHAVPAAGLVKAAAPLPVPVRALDPHPAASLSILFRNFRE